MPSDRRFRVAPGITGLTLRDGSKVDADKHGVIRVPERHSRDAHDAMKDTGLLSDRDGTIRVRGEGKDCVECGFCLYTWQQLCPRCHTDQPVLA